MLGMFPYSNLLLSAVTAVPFYIVLSVITVLKYRKTRDSGFIWLWVALVAWPLNAMLLPFLWQAFLADSFQDFRINGTPVNTSNFIVLVFGVARFVGYFLTAIAVSQLYRDYKGRSGDGE